MPRLLALFALLASMSANARDLAPQGVRDLTAKFKVTMVDCPQRIWTNYNWKGLTVVLVYPSGAGTWAWTASNGTLKKIPLSALPSSAVASTYDFFEMSGKPTLSINMEEEYLESFELGVHELFHFHGQRGWRRESGGARGTVYPLTWQPRLYRRMIFENLRRYLISAKDEDLGKARYWFNKWSDEYPNELKSTTDGYEGTADYAEKMATAVSELGCAASDDQLKTYIVSKLLPKYGHSVDGHQFKLDSEGYEIGGLATLALRFRGGSLGTWNSKVVSGQSPLELLLETAKPEPEIAPAAFLSEFLAFEQKANQEYASLLDADIAHWSDKRFVRVALDNNWLQSNLRPRFFAYSSQIQMQLYPLAANHHYLGPGGTSDFVIKANAVTFKHLSRSCSNHDSFVLVPLEDIKLTRGITNISTSVASGQLEAQLKSDENGFQYLCQ